MSRQITDWGALDHGPLAGPRVSREEFERQCVALSGGTVAQLRRYHEIVECDCGAEDCPGWIAVYKLRNKRLREGGE